MWESVRLVLSQQLAGIRFTIWTSKSESVVKSTNVVESTEVVESTDVESTDVVEFTDVSGLWVDVEPAGTREVRRGSCGAWWWHKRPLTTRVRPGPGKTVTSSQSVLLLGELWLESTVGSFGSSSTESPAVVTDDWPPWRTYFGGVYLCLLFVYFVISVIILICIIFHP